MYSSYAMLRRKFDSKIQNRITQRDVLAVIGELNDKKLLWQFDSQRVREDFEQMKIETDKKKRQKIIDRIVKKTVTELKLIYKITKDSKGYLISSLL